MNEQVFEKMDLQTPNFSNENVEKLAALFPNCVTEKKNDKGEIEKAIDFDLLRQEFSENIVEGPQERYSLNWPGKRQALATANTPITKTLRPCRDESVDFDKTKNIFIEGDNLDALKLLQETYLNKIKMIYIDPPYNTGKDFVYKDNFTASKDEYDLESGHTDEEGSRLVANPDSNGRYHSDWLSMIYPRLKLARNLLREDGVIFISIDDNEIENLKKICDEVFGEDNSLIPFVWELPRGINAGHISKSHEYILAYAKNKDSLPQFFREDIGDFSIDRCNKKIDERHPASEIKFPSGIKYTGANKIFSSKIEGSEEIFIEGEMVFENGQLKEPVTLTAGWTMKNMILQWLNGEKVYDTKGQEIVEFFFKDNGRLYSKKIAEFESAKSVLKSYGDYQTGRLEMESLFGNQDTFEYPKPTTLLSRLCSLVTRSDIILDFFGGSCPMAHSVFLSNLKYKAQNRFIIVQLPEKVGKEKVAYKLGFSTISDLGKERIRRAGKKILEDNKDKEGIENLDTGFRVFKIDSSNIKDVFLSPDAIKMDMFDSLAENIKEDRTAEDLLFGVLLDWGVDLSLPIECKKIAGKDVYFVDGNALAACFEENITEDFVKELSEHKPLRVVFRDSGFASSSVKINTDQIFKLKSPSTEIKVI